MGMAANSPAAFDRRAKVHLYEESMYLLPLAAKSS